MLSQFNHSHSRCKLKPEDHLGIFPDTDLSAIRYRSSIAMSTITYKIIVLGSSGVGKTALVQQLIDKTFVPSLQSTVGVEFKSWPYRTSSGEEVKLNIWDTAGQERFRSVSKAYFRNAIGALLVFAVDSDSSYADLDAWLSDLRQSSNPSAVILLVGNKTDVGDRQISEDQAREFAMRHELEYIETSAKSGSGVEDAFVRLAQRISDKVKRGEISAQAAPRPDASNLQVARDRGMAKENFECC
jgi:small GTP-binding protein